jgi:hypothetical protein
MNSPAKLIIAHRQPFFRFMFKNLLKPAAEKYKVVGTVATAAELFKAAALHLPRHDICRSFASRLKKYTSFTGTVHPVQKHKNGNSMGT